MTQEWIERYGTSAFNSGEPRAVAGGVVLQGADATVATLRSAAADLAGLRLSLPGASAAALGGLLFSPGPPGDYVDESAGLLPWPRLASLSLPRLVVCDATRFDPADPAHGPGWAATAVLQQSSALLLTRWPALPVAMRDAFVERIAAARAEGKPLAEAVAEVQRSYISDSAGAEHPALRHPRRWAVWLPFGLD